VLAELLTGWLDAEGELSFFVTSRRDPTLMPVMTNRTAPHGGPADRECAQPAVPFGSDELTELDGGWLVDVERGELHPRGSRLLLRAGRIEAILSSGQDRSATAGAARRVDLGGRYVVPGLCNTHCHLQIVMPSLLPSGHQNRLTRRHGWDQRYRNLTECTLRGVTTVRDTLTHDLRKTASLRSHSSRSRPSGPRILQAVLVAPLGGVFTPTRGIRQRIFDQLLGWSTLSYDDPHSGAVVFAPNADAATVRAAVDRAIDERGADAVKLYDQRERLLTFRATATLMSERQLEAAADQCRRRGVPCTMHALTVEAFRRAVRAGVRSIAHLPSDGLLGAQDIAAALAAGVIVEPTVSLLYCLAWHGQTGMPVERDRLQLLRNLRRSSAQAVAAEHWHPMLAPWFLAGLARSASGRTAMLGGLYDGRRIYDYYGGIVSHGIDNLERLVAARVPMACGTDAGAIPCTPAMVDLELALWPKLLGEAMATPAFMLRAATMTAARALGMASGAGQIAPGAPADLVAYERNPLEDGSVVGSRAAAVWRDGEMVVGAERLAADKG